MSNSRKNIYLACFFSLLFPGIGQLYNYQVKKALSFICSSAFISSFQPVYSSFGPTVYFGLLILGAVILVWSMIDAILTARRIKIAAQRKFDKWYSYLLWVILSWVASIGIYLIIGLYAYGSWKYYIPNNSMSPIIQNEDEIISSPIFYKHNKPVLNDVVLYKDIHGYLRVGRVVAVEGDRVRYGKNRLRVNQDMVYHRTFLNIDIKKIVPKDHIFIIYDNPKRQLIGEDWGLYPINAVIGKPLYVVFANEYKRWGSKIE